MCFCARLQSTLEVMAEQRRARELVVQRKLLADSQVCNYVVRLETFHFWGTFLGEFFNLSWPVVQFALRSSIQC